MAKLLPYDNANLSSEQAQAIISILVHQCDLIEERDNRDRKDYPDLYDPDYENLRSHSRTAAVLAGFRENTCLPGMSIRKRHYGIGHVQPEIVGEHIILQIYSINSSLSIDEIIDKCHEYNNGVNQRRFNVIQFRMSDKGHLTSADLIDFNQNGEIISRQTIFKHSKKESLAAA